VVLTWALVAVVTVVIAATVWSQPASAFPPTRPTRVLALGDSVMEGAAGAIPAALPGREVVVDTAVSRSTGATATAAAGHGTDWDVVVLLVGHNDGASPGVYQPPYRRMLDQFAGVPRVVVLTIHEARPYYAGVNAFLRDEATRRPNLRVADWNDAVNRQPGTTASDGLHLTGPGTALMAKVVSDQVLVAEVEFLPTTTTTATTTTTTTAPATTAAVLVPAPSIDRPPPEAAPSTTSSPPRATTTIPNVVDLASGADAIADDDGRATSPVVWVLLAAGLVAMVAILRRELGTRP
jgi:lysophospholipase L1-like esterase